MKQANIFTRLAVWLSRMHHSRGFGVQSPSAYRFIRYVVSEHYPYYAYAEMERKHPRMAWCERKMGRLYFRLANFCQAPFLVDFGAQSGMIAEYVQRGCRHTRLLPAAEAATTKAQEAWHFVRMCPEEGCIGFLAEAMKHADEHTIIVVEDIHSCRTARQLWRTLKESKAVSVTFDLYYCGIAFFDTSRFKQNYIVNF